MFGFIKLNSTPKILFITSKVFLTTSSKNQYYKSTFSASEEEKSFK